MEKQKGHKLFLGPFFETNQIVSFLDLALLNVSHWVIDSF